MAFWRWYGAFALFGASGGADERAVASEQAKEGGATCVRCGSRSSARFMNKGEVICEYRVGCRTREVKLKSGAVK